MRSLTIGFASSWSLAPSFSIKTLPFVRLCPPFLRVRLSSLQSGPYVCRSTILYWYLALGVAPRRSVGFLGSSHAHYQRLVSEVQIWCCSWRACYWQLDLYGNWPQHTSFWLTRPSSSVSSHLSWQGYPEFGRTIWLASIIKGILFFTAEGRSDEVIS
jgi:hypothetical protein